MRKGLKNVMKTLDKLGVSYETTGDVIRVYVKFIGVNGQECEVSCGDYGNAWRGFPNGGRTSKNICKSIEEHFSIRKDEVQP